IGELDTGRRIRLARAEVLNCKLEKPLSVAVRRNAHPPERPYFMASRSGPGGWEVKGPAETSGFGFEISTTVDTSCAKFRAAPRYFAHVLGQRKMRIVPDRADTEVVTDGFLTYYAPEERTDRLNVSVLVPQTPFERLMRATGAGGVVTADRIKAALKDLVNAT